MLGSERRNGADAIYQNAPDAERDACGIGFVAHIEGHRTHEVLRMALDSLCNHAHRGAIADDRKSGDGAGILSQIPYEFFKRELSHRQIAVPAVSDLAVGQLFFHRRDPEDRQKARDVIEAQLRRLGLKLVAYRNVPVIEAVLGERAIATRPWVEQVIVQRTSRASRAGEAFERLLYRARQRILQAAAAQGVRRLYIPSLSSRTIVYKGLVMADMLGRLYPDLHDPLFTTSFAIFHQRYSTNTLPTWERAQPFHMICHNGEINTIQGNENWMRAREPHLSAPAWPQGVGDLLPIIDADTSDSGKFDQQLELLVHSGRDIRHALMMMVPEAWERMPEGDVTPERRAFYEYHSALLEPWDGPASITYTDGRIVGTIMDRNGLRPARYAVLENGLVISGSEMGAVPYDESLVLRKGRLGPGQIFCVDTKLGVVMDDGEITRLISNRRPYGQWLSDNLISLEQIVLKSRRMRKSRLLRAQREAADDAAAAGDAQASARTGPSLTRRQIAFGFTSEEMVVVLRPLLSDGAEPIGAMGDDTPLAAVSQLPRPLFHYFKQRFAEVTNPPIDPLRETTVMSLRMLLGARGNLLAETPNATRLIELEAPVLQPDHFRTLDSLGGDSPEFGMVALDMTWRVDAPGQSHLSPGAQLQRAVQELCRQASDAANAGFHILVLDDAGADAERLPIPSLLATARLHHHLIRTGQRMQVSLVVKSGEPREVHHFAALIGYGANAVYPYLVYETIADMIGRERHFQGFSVGQATDNFVSGIHKGLLKIMSKMGISTLDSYCGAQVFEAVGIGEELIQEAFEGTPSLIGGVGYDTVAEDVIAWHKSAFPDAATARVRLPSWGLYKARRGGELHEWAPKVVHLIQAAVSETDGAAAWAAFKELTALQDSRIISPRHLLDFASEREPLSVDDVEPAAAIVTRFSTAAMSHGALSVEAHEVLAVAMNRLGGKSNCGEGGENPDRYASERVSKIKQVASGRFGVTPAYLMSAEELQIKIAQGSKPGEGGQLPGHKVTPDIAALRYATPGVALISPPPHHDIYSIEDLSQLIFDLKTANPEADVSVKLVSEMGVGTIAAGVVKGYADVVHIAGASGGTGASPLSSMKHAGLPWELGLAETHRSLMANGLRERTIIRTDGGLSTGRDVVMAAMLGADEFSFGTSAMIAEGCIMARVCHKDTCPVGVATQNPELRRKFAGTPEQVMRFMTFIAEEVREILAALGYASLNEVIGRPELLRQTITGRAAGFMNLEPLLQTVAADGRPHHVDRRNLLHASTALGDLLVEQVMARLEADPQAFISLAHSISNTDRTVGARLACQLAAKYGMDGLRDHQINITFTGSAGQSFGAFGIQGLHIALIGEANDYLGKGLNGGEIVLRPHARSKFVPQQNVILGNTALYGATGGHVYASGLAGERFGVRNSGATAVIEGAGEHACEYMTGGTVVILGETGRNFGAGMTGGEAFVYDVRGNFERRYNPELIRLRRLSNGEAEQRLQALLQAHVEKTGSVRGAQVLEDWGVQRQAIWHITPREGVHAIEARNEGMRMWDKERELEAEIPAESLSEEALSGFYTR